MKKCSKFLIYAIILAATATAAVAYIVKRSR